MNKKKINAQYLIISFIALVTISIVGIIFILSNNRVPNGATTSGNLSTSTPPQTTNDGDTQIIDMTAKQGFTPNEVTLKAGKPAILRVKTDGTYDCSASMAIPKLGINKIFDPTGTTDINIPAQSVGSEINGTCSMGMYSFKIKVI